MAFNNIVTLTGNMGAEATILQSSNKSFAALPLATADSYQDEHGNWQQKATLWHQVLDFSPRLVRQLGNFKKGSRLKITGSLSYRSFEITLEDGRAVIRQEASIIAHKIERAPLP